MKPFASLSSPQRLSLFYQSVAILVIAAIGWAAFVGALSLLSPWVVVLATAALAVMVYVRGQKGRQRQEWIDSGHCAACGYDLRLAPSTVCPECGRDARLDEPVWRRLQREHAAKFGRPDPTAAAGEPLDEAEIQAIVARAKRAVIDLDL